MASKKPTSFGPNRAALEEAIEQLATAPQFRALVQSCRALADRLDGRGVCLECGAGFFDDALWREYRLWVKQLMEATAGGDSDDFDRLQEALKG